MSRILPKPLVFLCVFVMAFILVVSDRKAVAQEKMTPMPSQDEVKHDVSPKALSEIPPLRVETRGPRFEREIRHLPPLPEVRGPQADRLVQKTAGAKPKFSVIRQFAGLSWGDNLNDITPPDTTGAVGSKQYVQWVNETFAIYGKDGKILYGPADGNTLWNAFGGACEDDNDGDPVVLFDNWRDADNTGGRWVMAQFAVTGAPPYYECVAISTTDDALGKYYRYAFKFENLNDYPKIGVWPDAYYAAFNMYKKRPPIPNKQDQYDFLNARACAMDRQKMLRGQKASMQCFNPKARGLLPADLDGTTPPPAGSPGYFADYATGKLRIWEFSANWKKSSKSTFVGTLEIPVESFAEGCHLFDQFICINQPGTSIQLDSLGDRLMYRLAYRNIGGRELMVVNHAVDVQDPSDKTGKQTVTALRWYELERQARKPWSVFQQGTFSPDLSSSEPTSRWIGSMAADDTGNLLIGYNVSGSTVFPSIRTAGRCAGDAANELEQEVPIASGGSSQVAGQYAYRWGDYSSVTLDPEGHTFWFTSEYMADTQPNKPSKWKTLISLIQFDKCP